MSYPDSHGPNPRTDSFPPASWQTEPNPGLYATPDNRRSLPTGAVVLLTVLTIGLLALAGLVAYLLLGRDTGQLASAPAVTSTATATATAAQTTPAQAPASQVQPAAEAAQVEAPAGSALCSDAGGGRYSRAAAGTGNTSCSFAASVRSAYIAAGNFGSPTSVTAYSPATGSSYSMYCTGSSVVTCSGGNNALVYIY